MTDIVKCANVYAHDDLAAVVRVSWPGGRFNDTTACRECLEGILEDIIHREPDQDYPVLISPVDGAPVTCPDHGAASRECQCEESRLYGTCGH